MSLDRDAVPRSASSPFWPHYRKPRSFAGAAGEDVDEWLTCYQRVSQYNKWDATAQLTNVVFALTHMALMWYQNHEDTFMSCMHFIEELSRCFGDSAPKKKQAEQTLAHRAQLPGETYTQYIEAVLRLCKLVSPRMSDEDKVGHLLKGFAKDIYTYLISKQSLASVSNVIGHCRRSENLKIRRITPKFGHLATVPTVAGIDFAPASGLASTIRQIVRDELIRWQDITCHPSEPPTAYPQAQPQLRSVNAALTVVARPCSS